MQEHPLRKYYLAEHKRYSDSKFHAFKSLDHTILIVTTGVFVLSVNYLNGLGDNYLIHTWTLIGAWISFAAAIIANLIAYFFLAKASSRTVDILNNWADKEFNPNDFTTVEIHNKDPHVKKSLNFVSFFKLFTYLSLLIGFFLIIFFSSTNLVQSNKINKLKDSNSLPTKIEAEIKILNKYTE